MPEYSVSMSRGDKIAEVHDRRDYTPRNAERALADQNLTLYSAGDDYKQAFNDFFADSIARYNEKQTRDDRKKSFDYFGTLENGKQKEIPMYEYVLQIGNRDDLGVTGPDFDVKHWQELKSAGRYNEASQYVLDNLNNSKAVQDMRQVLIDIGKELPEKYPNLKFWGIHLHADEPGGTMHLHAICTPFIEGSKTGLDKRVSLRQAMAAMGFKTTGTEYGISKWQNQVKADVAERMEAAGYQREFKSDKEKHLSVGEYKYMKELERLDEQTRQAEQHAAEAEQRAADADRRAARSERRAADAENRVQEVSDQVADLEHQAADLDLEIRRKRRRLDERDQEQDEREERLNARERMLYNQEEQYKAQVAAACRGASDRVKDVVTYAVGQSATKMYFIKHPLDRNKAIKDAITAFGKSAHERAIERLKEGNRDTQGQLVQDIEHNRAARRFPDDISYTPSGPDDGLDFG